MIGLGASIISAVASHDARAAGGVFEINEACAANTGCFPGDVPGYPVSITTSAGARSFRLTSDLVVPGFSGTAITVEADDVSIDLAGFRVTRASCITLPGNACAGGGGLGGIAAASADGLSIRDGVVAGAGRDGIHAGDRLHLSRVTVRWNSGAGVLAGDRAVLDRVRAIDNLLEGIQVGASSTIRRSLSEGNFGRGIDAETGSSATSTLMVDNGLHGIDLESGAVRGSVSSGNGQDPFSTGNPLLLMGIRVATGSVDANVVVDNPTHGIFAILRGDVTRNVSAGSGDRGIVADGQIDRNVVRSSGSDGILATNARIAQNVVRESGANGISGNFATGARGNTVSGSGAANLTSVVDLGANACDGAPCP